MTKGKLRVGAGWFAPSGLAVANWRGERPWASPRARVRGPFVLTKCINSSGWGKPRPYSWDIKGGTPGYFVFTGNACNVLAAGILMSAAFSLGACNRARPQDDKTITREIQAKLYHDAILKTRDISIIAQSGVVVLSGQVSSEDERASAERLAAAVGGVKQVINQLAVVGRSPAATPPAPKTAHPERSPSSQAKR